MISSTTQCKGVCGCGIGGGGEVWRGDGLGGRYNPTTVFEAHAARALIIFIICQTHASRAFISLSDDI